MPRLRASAALLAATVAAATALAATPQQASPWLIDEDPPACSFLLGLVPAAVAADHLFGPELELTTLVVVDTGTGLSSGKVSPLLKEAADLTFDSGLRVKMRFAWARTNLGSADKVKREDAFAAAAAFAGRHDVTYLVTDKDIEGAAGVANCIGGISDPGQSYAIGEYFDDDITLAGGATLFRNFTGKVFAHEIGHLLGAHHHQANCAEGTHSQPVQDPASPCTLMFNFVDLVSFNFSVVNAAVARGHVAEFGRKNQG